MSEIIDRLEGVAECLQTLLPRLVFTGGGVTELLITDSAGRKPRPTKDVDCIIDVASRVKYNQVETELRSAGFVNDPNDPPILCRFIKGTLILDVMPTLEGILGFTNRWYKDAVAEPIVKELPSGAVVNIIQAVYFLATKTEAFRDRGKGDFRSSHDFEDIVTIMNGREEIVSEMQVAELDVLEAMREFWLPKLGTANLIASIREHLDSYEDIQRTQIVLERFKRMLS